MAANAEDRLYYTFSEWARLQDDDRVAYISGLLDTFAMAATEPPRGRHSITGNASPEALPKLTVKFGEQFIRVYEDTAVNTGYYTLFYTKDGETKSIPARYSFTYVREGNDCKIVDHHSSAMPAPPR